MKDKKIVISQPGKLGDILITAPIAKFYSDLGYEVHWPVLDNFFEMVSRFDYVKPVSFGIGLHDLDYYSNKRVIFQLKKDYEETDSTYRTGIFYKKFYETYLNNQEFKIVDPCFAFPGHDGEKNISLLNVYRETGKNWINLKYDIVAVPLRERWNLQYNRNLEKEEKLLELIKNYSQKKYGSDNYSIVHSYKSDILPKYNSKNPINFSFIKGYEITDWLQVLQNADEIVCVDSCLCNYVEVMPSLKEIKKVYLGTEEPHYNSVMRNILFNNWINLSQDEIDYGYNGLEDL